MPRLIAILVLAIFGAGLAEAAPREVRVPDRFDGTWNVTISTDSGACDRTYRYPVRIDHGQARFVGLPIAVDGGVAPNGALSGSITAGASTATVVGRLRPDGFGTGRWFSVGALACRGRWDARRSG